MASKVKSRSLGDLLIDKGLPILLAVSVAGVSTYFQVDNLKRDAAVWRQDHDVVTKLASQVDYVNKQLDGIQQDLKTITRALPR